MQPPDVGPDPGFETDLLAYDEALATGRPPSATPRDARVGRARSLLQRLERDRRDSRGARDSRADPTSELTRLLHAEGLLDLPAAAGAPFGRFRLLRELGRGGCAS